MNPEITARLQGLGINVVAESSAVSVFVRECCVAVAGRTADGGFSLGSTGMMTENGPAYLVWRQGQPRLAGKGGEVPADNAQVETIRRFSEDLQAALDPTALDQTASDQT